MTDRADRTYDLVLWGATGFAGRLVAEYLVDHWSDQLYWAIGGRSLAKLEALRDELAGRAPNAEPPAIVTGDALDRDSLAAIAAQTRVVCSTVGPYAKYGSPLVDVCVAHQTDYCDLTGEVQWIRRMIEAHHDAAVASATRIVHCCGFDSIPSDLGCQMVERYATRTHGAPCDRVKYVLRGMSGGMSGGTLDSMANLFEEVGRDRSVLKTVGHPYALNPAGERRGPDGGTQNGLRYDEDLAAWTGPFVMAAVNEKIVRRTNALLGYPWGRDFRYSESMRTGAGVGGAAKAAALAGGLGAFTGAMALGPTRKLLQRFVLPAPGEGPSRERIDGGFFAVDLVGHGTGADGAPFEIRARVGADRDPGYGATAIMLGEAAVCLASGQADDDALGGGVLTPASAMGQTLVDRLRDAGMTWSVADAGS